VRHHLYDRTVQRAFQRAARLAGLVKPASCHTLHTPVATQKPLRNEPMPLDRQEIAVMLWTCNTPVRHLEDAYASINERRVKALRPFAASLKPQKQPMGAPKTGGA
jgi:hypothetical protein